MMETRQPTLWRILQTDYAAYFAALFVVILWGFTLYDFIRGQELQPSFLYLLGSVTVVGLIVLAWRTAWINTLYNEGQEALATIHKVTSYRGRTRITFVHVYHGEKYLSNNMVVRNKRTRGYVVGDQVVVLVDSNRPKKACIKELYI
jgi:hypothetical protein